MLYPAELWVRNCYKSIARIIAGTSANAPITIHSCFAAPLNDVVPAFGTNQHTDKTRNVIINVKIMSITLQPHNSLKQGTGFILSWSILDIEPVPMTTSSRKKSYHDSSSHL